jgi:hypothetical protein
MYNEKCKSYAITRAALNAMIIVSILIFFKMSSRKEFSSFSVAAMNKRQFGPILCKRYDSS